MPNVRLVIKYFWRESRDHKLAMFLCFLGFGTALTFSGIVEPLIFKGIIDAISSAEGATPEVQSRLLFLVGLVFGSIVVTQLGFRMGDFAMSRFESTVMRKLSIRAFEALERHSYAFFSNAFAGSLVAKVKRYVTAFENIFDRIVFDLWWTSIRVIGTSLILIYIQPLLGTVFAIGIFLFILTVFWRGPVQARHDASAAAADSSVTASLADAISNVLTIKMFSSERREAETFEGVARDWEGKQKRAWYYGNWTYAVQSSLIGVIEIINLYVAIWLWVEGEISAGTIVLAQTYLLLLVANLISLGRAFRNLTKGFSDAKEMVEILEQKPDIKDPAKPEKARISGGEIVFDRATFSYGEGHDHVFREFNLAIKPGERIGLVGTSGAGKTTITKLLLRFMDLQSGEIRIDGQNIARIRQDELRACISYVPQEPLLFHRSLRENIAYGRPEATDAQIEEAARRAHAHEFISRLPLGYDTLVGERGIKLSGGERQRVAIARAILKEAPILILDEATSSLDTVSETLIQEAFDEVMRSKTTIAIAHRLSTIRKMDRILVLEKGQIVEEGTHETLLAHDGVYAGLWKRQAGMVV